MADGAEVPKDETLHEQAIRRANEAWLVEVDNYENGRDDLRFYEGEQWDPAAKNERLAQNRPVITVNRLKSFVRQVTGDVRRDTPSIKIAPAKGKASQEMAEVYNGIIRNIEQQSNAKAAYTQATEHACIPGMGNIKVVTEYSDNDSFNQDIRIKRIPDAFSVLWDPAAKEPDKSDARYLFEFTDIPREEFHRQFPKATVTSFPSGPLGTGGFAWFTLDTVRVAQYWYREPVKKLLLILADGRTVDSEQAKKEAAENGSIPKVIRQREIDTWAVKQVLMSGTEELTKPAEWAGKHIPYAPVIGEETWVDGRVIRSGMIRSMKDPQRVYNYMRTAAVEAAALQPKMPWLLSQNQVKGLEGWWQKAGSANLPYLVYNDSNNPNPPQRAAPALAQTGLDQQSLIAADELKAVPGIYDASLGAQGNETSGKAILARQREGDTGTYHYIDNLATGIRRVGEILLDLIPKIYDTPRVVRVLREDGDQEMVGVNVPQHSDDPMFENVAKRMNDLAAGEYDVTVTVGPSFSTRREEARETIQQVIQAYPDLMKIAGDVLFKNMDMPGADEVAKRLEPPPPGTPPPTNPADEAKAAKDAATAVKTKAEAEGQQIENAGMLLQLKASIDQIRMMLSGGGAPGGPMPGGPPQIPGGQAAGPQPQAMPSGQMPPMPPSPMPPQMMAPQPNYSMGQQPIEMAELAPIDEPKRSKESVDYSKGMGERRCGNCVHYLGGACELVEGRIEPDMWCELFEKGE